MWRQWDNSCEVTSIPCICFRTWIRVLLDHLQIHMWSPHCFSPLLILRHTPHKGCHSLHLPTATFMAKNFIFPCIIISKCPSLPTLAQHWNLSHSWWQHKVNLELHWLFSESFFAVSPLWGHKRPSVAQGRTVTLTMSSCHFWWEAPTRFPRIRSSHEVWLKKEKLSPCSWWSQIY